MFQNLSTQQKGSLLAFVGVMFITPDSLFIRLASIETWSLLFYRGAIPFITVLLSLLIIYKSNFFKILDNFFFEYFKIDFRLLPRPDMKTAQFIIFLPVNFTIQ